LLVLDTDHFSEWERGSAAGERLRVRLEAAQQELAVTVVTLEEQMRGWLAEISRRHEPHRQIPPYAKLQRQVDVFSNWTVLPWDAPAADLFLESRRQGVRVGSLDLKIACIARAQDATLLTRNTNDFAQVPNLRFENWLG
jgi:tRNA(fMet)-specific endonuclease VapC